jgi:hypothetical protein
MAGGVYVAFVCVWVGGRVWVPAVDVPARGHGPLGEPACSARVWPCVSYDSSKCDYQQIGTVYDPVHCKYYLLRGVSATFGSLVRCRPATCAAVS